MASETPAPRLAGFPLRTLATAASTPVIGSALVAGMLPQFGLDALDEADLEDPSVPPATMPTLRKGGAR